MNYDDELSPRERSIVLVQNRITELETQLAAANQELERWRHGATIEGDFVCPHQLEASNLRAELREVREALRTALWMADGEDNMTNEQRGEKILELMRLLPAPEPL